MSSERLPRRLRQRVAERARWRCEYCLSPAAFSCGCNSYKEDRTHPPDPETGRHVPLFNPRRQRWARHFAWSEGSLLILGRTATGRATVEALHLNRPELVNLRRLLHLIGEQPPGAE